MSLKNLDGLKISLSGYYEVHIAELIGKKVSALLKEMSQIVDLSYLDGVTISYDYIDSVRRVDRGREDLQPVELSSRDVEGVAITLTVIRNEMIKAHIVMNALYVEGLIEDDANNNDFLLAVNLIAHECIHVSNCAALDRAFPHLLLKREFRDVYDNLRSNCWLLVFEEYCATRMSSLIGLDQKDTHKKMFLDSVSKLDGRIGLLKIQRGFNVSDDSIFLNAYREISNALKISAYYLGDCAARNENYKDADVTLNYNSAWLLPYIDELNDICNAIYDNYGRWKDISEISALSEVVNKIIQRYGI